VCRKSIFMFHAQYECVPVFTDGDLWGLVGVYAYVGSIVALTWVLGSRLDNARKALHILTGGIVFFWWAFDTKEIMAGLAAAPFIVILLLVSPKSPVPRLRRTFLGTKSSEGHPHGLVLYAVSWTLIAYFMFDNILSASIAIAAMSFGDGMGEVIGRRYGRLEYMRHRTLEGTAAVMLTVAASVLLLVWFYCGVVERTATVPANTVLLALAIGGFVACLEAVTPGRLDNLVVPLVTGGYLYVLGV
jgi:phytol kinase